MPATEVITESGYWTVPESCVKIDAVLKAMGGLGGPSDPVMETGGGGGGQGGSVSVGSFAVSPGEVYSCGIFGDCSFVGPIGNLEGRIGMYAYRGGDSETWQGADGGGGFGGSVTMGAKGQDAGINGGNGGGSEMNRGTPTDAPFPAGVGQGGGGQGFNGPGPVGQGGRAEIAIVCYPAEWA